MSFALFSPRTRAFRSVALLATACLLLASLTGCTQAYYSAMEQVGRGKADILRSRIEAGRDDQEEAQEQIKTTYERLKEAARFEGGDLESMYNRLNADYERSAARADDVTSRIRSIERVAADLWTEWESEIAELPRASQQSRSRSMLQNTQASYERVIGAMKRAESKMPPVLDAFRGEVLMLKHNLNAQAIASLEGTVVEIENDVEELIREIDASIQEAQSFLAELDRG